MVIGIYIRVSSEAQAQDGHSLQAQKDRLTSYCDAQGWENYKFYIDKGLTGRNTKRPAYQDLIKDVKKRRINIILVYKLDRIMRSIADLDSMLHTLEEFECGFKSATEPFDTTNPTGKLFMYIVGAFAQWESDVSSERIKMVLAERVENDRIWIGGVPYPFDRDPDKKILRPNKERSKETLKMIDMLFKGYSSNRISDYFNTYNNDKVTWYPKTIIRTLRNPALCGDTIWNGKIYKDTHEGIISREKFNKIQTMLKDRSKTRSRHVESTYIFQGKIICPSCKETMPVNRFFRKRKDGSVYQGATYSCPPCAKAKLFNRYPSERIFLDAFYNYFENIKLDEIKQTDVKVEKPKEIDELKKIESRREKYQRAWARDLMTDDEFKKMMEETRESYEELKLKVSELKDHQPIDFKEMEHIVFTFNNNFKALTTDEKREFISRFIRNIEFEIIEQPPLNPRRAKVGRYKLNITNVTFY